MNPNPIRVVLPKEQQSTDQIVDGGFAGENGVGYLEDHGVEIQRTDGPKDPRSQG